MNPRWPVYVISRRRADSRLTGKALDYMRVPYRMVIEESDYDAYAAVMDPAKILVMPSDFRTRFRGEGDPDPMGGPVPARNFVWETALETSGREGWHWVLDDNIQSFHRLYFNMKVPVTSGTIFRLAEDYADRFENVVQAGFQYYMFVPRKTAWKFPPVFLNTRIYSCILLKNDLPYRWRGLHQEDTDLSLRILKDGWCTILFNAFLADKMATLTMKGGNTDELYAESGRLRMARLMVEEHPDVSKVVWKWGRWQHSVDYRPFKANKLRLKPGFEMPTGYDEHGMILEHYDGRTWSPAEPPSREEAMG